MKFELFELETIKYIFDNFYTWLGSLIMIMAITGDLRRVSKVLKTFFSKTGDVYRKITAKDKFAESLKDRKPKGV